jgi:hypothetical protein
MAFGIYVFLNQLTQHKEFKFDTWGLHKKYGKSENSVHNHSTQLPILMENKSNCTIFVKMPQKELLHNTK